MQDNLFYEDAIKAVQEPDKQPIRKRPIVIIAGLFIILIIVLSFIPLYNIKINPPPDINKINNFQLSPEELSELENLSTKHYSTIKEATENMNVNNYHSISARLATSACSSSSRLCYAKALFYYVQNKVVYINDPYSREYVQLPQETVIYKQGDCEDLSLALAAMLESIGIDADVGVTSNHAFVRAKIDAPFWISRNGYVYLDPSSNEDFGKISFKESEVIRFYEIY